MCTFREPAAFLAENPGFLDLHALCRWRRPATRVPFVSPKATFSTTSEASVEYRLLRDALAKAVLAGKIRKEDACDAHPELVRAASNLGKSTGDKCPICKQQDTVEVTYVFGAKLPAGGTCPSTKTELNRLLKREDPVQAYTVEVCTACHFHHLLRRYPGGGDQKPAAKRGSLR